MHPSNVHNYKVTLISFLNPINKRILDHCVLVGGLYYTASEHFYYNIDLRSRKEKEVAANYWSSNCCGYNGTNMIFS